MTDRTIYVERLPYHELLGRNVVHDSTSRLFALPEPALPALLQAVRHESFIAILHQQIGSCTGCSGVNAIYRRPFFTGTRQAPWPFAPSDPGATDLYSAATIIDPWPGAYPPEDTGSDGLSIAKVLKNRGVISGFQWAFTLSSALAALQSTPLLTGLIWYNSMFDTDGRYHTGHVVVRADSGVAGGHELCVDEYVPATGGSPALVGGPNSWGTSWGDGGRWYLTVDEWGSLLAQDGDVTALTPATVPPPEPTPTLEPATPADRALRATVGDKRIDRKSICANTERQALRTWRAAKDWT